MPCHKDRKTADGLGKIDKRMISINVAYDDAASAPQCLQHCGQISVQNVFHMRPSRNSCLIQLSFGGVFKTRRISPPQFLAQIIVTRQLLLNQCETTDKKKIAYWNERNCLSTLTVPVEVFAAKGNRNICRKFRKELNSWVWNRQRTKKNRYFEPNPRGSESSKIRRKDFIKKEACYFPQQYGEVQQQYSTFSHQMQFFPILRWMEYSEQMYSIIFAPRVQRGLFLDR